MTMTEIYTERVGEDRRGKEKRGLLKWDGVGEGRGKWDRVGEGKGKEREGGTGKTRKKEDSV